MANASAREELRRLIQAHVDPQHRDHAIKLLDAITATAGAQAMLNLALDGPAPFGGVSWNANPVASFDLVDSSSGHESALPHGQSRFGVAFQIPPSDQAQPAQPAKQIPQDPAPAPAPPQPAPSPAPAPSQPAPAPAAPAPAPSQPPPPQHPAKFSSVVGGTAVSRPPGAVGGVAPPTASADQQLKQKTAAAALEAQRREEAKLAEARRAEANRTTGVGKGVDPKSNNPKVKLRGLPYGSTVADVLNFFRGFGVIDGSVTFGVNSEGRPSGEAWVSFNRLDDARRAVREKDRHHMGDRYVELFLLSEGGGVAGR